MCDVDLNMTPSWRLASSANMSWRQAVAPPTGMNGAAPGDAPPLAPPTGTQAAATDAPPLAPPTGMEGAAPSGADASTLGEAAPAASAPARPPGGPPARQPRPPELTVICPECETIWTLDDKDREFHQEIPEFGLVYCAFCDCLIYPVYSRDAELTHLFASRRGWGSRLARSRTNTF